MNDDPYQNTDAPRVIQDIQFPVEQLDNQQASLPSVSASPIVGSTFRHKTLLTGIIPTAVLLLAVSSFALWQSTKSTDEPLKPAVTPIINSVDLNDVTPRIDKVSEADILVVNGALIANEGFVLSAQRQPVSPAVGQLYYDSSLSALRLYDGTQFTTVLTARNSEGAEICYVGSDCGFLTSADVVQGGTGAGQNGGQGPQGPAGATGPQGPAGPQGADGAIGQAVCANGDCLSLQPASPGTAEQGNINISGNILLDGNIGIGTDTPNSRLHVVGDTYLDGNVTVGDLTPLVLGSSTVGIRRNAFPTIDSDAGTAIVRGPDGFMRILAADWYTLNFLRCTDESCSSPVINEIDPGTGGGQSAVAMSIGPDGFPRLAYSDPNDDLIFVRCTDSDCTGQVVTAVDTIHEYAGGYGVAMSIGPDGFPRLAYRAYNGIGYSTNSTFYMQCTDADCLSPIINVIDISEWNYDTVDMVLGSDSFARIVYIDQNDYTLKLARCTDAACTSPIITEVDSSVEGPGYYGSGIGIAPDGYPRIVYNDWNGILWHARCTDADCTTPVIVQVTESGYPDSGFGFALDTLGNAWFSYDNYAGDRHFYFAHCTNADCTTRDEILMDNVGTNLGDYANALALGPDGFPAAAYNGWSSAGLRYAKLGTIDGSGISTPGSNIGSSSEYFGQAYVQGLSVRGSSSTTLLTLDQFGASGAMIDFQFQNASVGSLSALPEGITISSVSTSIQSTVDAANAFLVKNAAGQSLLTANTLNSSVSVRALVDGTNTFGVQNAAGQSLLTANTLNSSVAINSPTNNINAFVIRGSEGDNVLQVDTSSRSLTVGASTDSSEYSVSSYTTGNTPVAVTGADLDGDGSNDMAVANNVSDTVSVFLNNGDGTFASRIDYATGSEPVSVTTADLDGDGDIDLAVANYDTASVSVFLNNGDGTFASRVDYVTGSGPPEVVSADLDGDGDIDLAVANYLSDTVSVFLNNGDGTFAAKVDYVTGSGPWSVTTTDFDGDGDKDLAATNYSSANFSVFLNNGDGTFASRVDYAAGGLPLFITNSDLNSDGYSDIVTTRDTAPGAFSVFLNNGDGTFAAQVDYVTGSYPYSVTTADLDSDGDQDITVANTGSNTVSTYLNNGDGTFATKTDIDTGSGPRSVTAIDLNDDGVPDLAIAYHGLNSVRVIIQKRLSVSKPPSLKIFSSGNDVLKVEGLRNRQIFRVDGQGNATIGGNQSIESLFDPKTDYTTDDNPWGVATGDFNGDGHLDIVTSNYVSHTVSVLINNGNGTFAGNVDYATGNGPWSVTTADYNQDGFIDIAVSANDASAVSILINNGNGTFAASINYATGSNPRMLASADFNLDGYPDVVTADWDNTKTVLLNNGNGTLGAPATTWSGGRPRAVTTGDFNNDGYPDIAVTRVSDYYIAIFPNDGNGVFDIRPTYDVGGNDSKGVVSGDFNEDGNVDLAVAHTGNNRVSILIGDGLGTFAYPVTYAFDPGGASDLTKGDFNDDGHLDLAIATYSTISVLNGNGNGTFGTYVAYSSSGAYSIESGDFNNDGVDDIVSSNYAGPNVSVYMKSGNPVGRLTVFNTDGDARVLNLGMMGDLSLQNAVDSTSAFQVQNSSGGSLLTVDTLNSTVVVRSPVDNESAFEVQSSNASVLFSVDSSTQTVTVVSTIVNGTLTVNGHILTANTSGTTTVVAGVGAGTGAIVSVVGNDTSGRITIDTGTGSGIGSLATIEFANDYGALPRVILTPANSNGATLQYYYNASTSTFDIHTNSIPTDSTQYIYSYWVVE